MSIEAPSTSKSKMMHFRKVCRLLCFVLAGVAVVFPKWAYVQDHQKIHQEIMSALNAKDYRHAEQLAHPLSASEDPDVLFSYVVILADWIGDPYAKDPYPYTNREFIDLIERAAVLGSPQASAMLRLSYEWGKYSLPRNMLLVDCWRDVEAENVTDIRRSKAKICVEKTHALDK